MGCHGVSPKSNSSLAPAFVRPRYHASCQDEEEWVLSADDDQVYAVTLQATPMLWTEQSGVPLTPPIWVDTGARENDGWEG